MNTKDIYLRDVSEREVDVHCEPDLFIRVAQLTNRQSTKKDEW